MTRDEHDGMEPWKARLLAEWAAALARARTDPTSWVELAMRTTTNDEGHLEDAHHVERAKVIWALQYDRRETDGALLRFLLSEESRWHRERPFQGLSEALELAAYLVAASPQPGDTALMWAAKRANFDTWAGFDSRYLSIEGAAAALAFAAQSNVETAGFLERVVDEDGKPLYSDDDLAALLSEADRMFPSDPVLEPPTTWLERARLLGDFDSAAEAISLWRSGESPPSPSAVTYAYASVHRYADAVRAHRAAMAQSSKPRDRPRETARLAELLRLAGDCDAATTAIEDAAKTLRKVRTDDITLRRQIAHQAFLTAAADPDIRRARATFELGERVSRPIVSLLPFVVRIAAAEAAAHIGDRRRQARWTALADAEQARINKDLEGLRSSTSDH